MNTELTELQRRLNDAHLSSDGLRYRITELEAALKREKELREGDNLLILSLAKEAGIKINCNPKLLGLVWEQFRDGVMELRERVDTL